MTTFEAILLIAGITILIYAIAVLIISWIKER